VLGTSSEGYRFDVGASMIFGFGTQGTTNLPPGCCECELETIPDPVQIHYHLPSGLDLKVHQDYENSCRADGSLNARHPPVL